jgi:CheY-like chemotaxis protein
LDASDYCILVAEDNTAVRYLTTRALRTRGYCVLEACDGGDDLQRAAEYDGTSHVLVTEVRMPHLDGHELAQKLKSSGPNVMIVMFQRRTKASLHQKRGAHDTALLKPVDSDSLLVTLAKLLRERGDVPTSES